MRTNIVAQDKGGHKGKIFVITTLAIYQTRFWAAIAEQLRQLGHEVAFLSFDDRSTEYLLALRYQVFTAAPEDQRQAAAMMRDSNSSLEAFGITELPFWLTHERFAFELRDSEAMTKKLFVYLALAERCLNSFSSDRHVVLLQELGGFISVIASFFAARKWQIDNWFVEPSFFKGRQYFLKNQFSAINISDQLDQSPCEEVREYLAEAQANKTIVVPIKDKRHYSAAIRKIVNWHNLRRLVEKSIDKYLLGKHQEFGHLGSHVRRHLIMLKNSLTLKRSYSEINKLGRFIYYPLHVPGDMALTLRSPEFLDQLGLIDYLLRSLPNGYKLAIKEHPAMIGAVDARRLKQLLERYDQLALIKPSENNYDVLAQSDAVISVNSKSGAEAMLLGKPVLVLGDAFYRNSPFTKAVSRLTDIGSELRKCLADHNRPSQQQLESYFQNVWQSSFTGELYV